MKELAPKVNVIPVIAKADTVSKDELKRFKKKIADELQTNKINVYKFPTDDEAVAPANRSLNVMCLSRIY